MTEIAKSVLGGSWTLVLGWILPSSLGWSLFGFLVIPSLTNLDIFASVSSSSASNQALVLLAASVILGLTLASVATPLYRVLEGYVLWPPRRAASMTEKHVLARRAAKEEVTKARGAQGRLDLRGALALERFRRYPDDEDQIAPTRLGNAIRRFEYYSYDRYQLSSQLLWNQLRATASESVVKDVDDARAGVDFFVCLLYVSGAASVSALLALLSPERQAASLILAFIIGAAVAVACYRLAVVATDAWSSAVRALVDTGRLPLAKGLGLRMPETLAQEREMWQHVGWFLGYSFNAGAVGNLDAYRAVDETGEHDGGDEE
ncbi:hypothetical protein C6I20_11550 [Aeromicrobium sp. A1-2]|uniref:hypothetical protein n=1 Tax=Aeromicrobium sp. A1-2 TaxID=2107713 RepID=UPI000E5391F8|nr:hypothetical protein [Aeromicrobium sp. A1-2]AXT85759.1 hypothetical protein C6I20_11550 [Aeromicrobium sp. A1-2]